MPTISDLKDQARALEQQGQIEKALTIYQHILKHLEGNPAITKVLPLYVKAGDLLLKMEREEEAVDSYLAAAEHYATTGAAPRVVSLCEKILRLDPKRGDVYTDFARQLIEHGHVGSARDVLAEYAQIENMDRAVETLNDLAGRPNSEIQPMLESLLDSFEAEGEEEQSEQTAERVSIQLEQDADNLAGELIGVPEEAEADEVEAASAVAEEEEEEEEEEDYFDREQPEEELESAEPLTPHLLDLDHMERKSSIQRAITDDDLAAMADDTPVIEHAPEAEITANVTPTMESAPIVQGPSAGDGGMDLLLAEAMISEDVEEAEPAADAGGAVEIERSEWQAEFPEPSAEETVAAEWSPEEELQPAARYPSDEYETPSEVEEELEQEAAVVDSEALDAEIARVVAAAAEFAPATDESTPEEEAEAAPVFAPEPAPEPEPAEEVVRRPSKPPLVRMPDKAEAKQKSPVLFGVGGFVVGFLAGAGLTFVLVGGGSESPTAAIPIDEPAAAVERRAEPVQPPAATQPDAAARQTIPETTEDEVPAETPMVAAADSEQVALPAEPDVEAPPQAEADTALAVATPVSSAGNPIIVEGMEIEEFSEVESGGRSGFRVVHLLDWADPLVIEAYRDTTVRMSTFIQVNLTPPDTVVGIRRLDGYMVYASGVMPEDSLRSLMSRLVQGVRPPN